MDEMIQSFFLSFSGDVFQGSEVSKMMVMMTESFSKKATGEGYEEGVPQMDNIISEPFEDFFFGKEVGYPSNPSEL